MSAADNGLYRTMVGGVGGVAFADEVFYPQTQGRELIKIEKVHPATNAMCGQERWIVKHSNGSKASYIVTWKPSTRGGSDFAVRNEKGIKTQDVDAPFPIRETAKRY